MTNADLTSTREAAMWREYDTAAEWCARRGLLGVAGDPLPDLMGADTCAAINDDLEAFAERVKATAYALAMEAAGIPDHSEPTTVAGSDGECLGCGAECVADAAGEYACGKCGVSWTVKAGAQ